MQSSKGNFNGSLQLFTRLLPFLIIFLTSMVIMVLELTASRITGSHLGNSFYTWVSVIVVILMGTSLGNYLGGKLAEKQGLSRLLFIILSSAGVCCFLILLVNQFFSGYGSLNTFPWPWHIFIVIFILFILPALFLGAVNPVAAKLVLEQSKLSGLNIGNIYAWGSLGSILGTFITGFYLIATFGVSTIIVGMGFLLLILAALVQILLQRSTENSGWIMNMSISTPKSTDDTIDDNRSSNGPNKPFVWKYSPYGFAFLNSLFLMTIEVTAGRMISRYFGNSLYTWTSLIGVILAGLALGYYIGGCLAEKLNRERYIYRLFGVNSFLILMIPISIHYLRFSIPIHQFSLPWHVFITVLAAMLFPAITTGAISIVTVTLAFQRDGDPGSTIGTVNAWSIAGSVTGTIVAGFWLIPIIGLLGIIQIIALCLALIALTIGSRRWFRWLWLLLLVIIIFITLGNPQWISPQVIEYTQKLGLRNETKPLFSIDSQYQHVEVFEVSQQKNHRIRGLGMDSLVHGYFNLDNPSDLNYQYEHIYAEITRRYTIGKKELSAFFIGGGSYTFPRWLLYQQSNSRIDVAEIDPEVVRANHLALGLPMNSPIHSWIGDARNVISSLPPDHSYDFFYGDAFNDFSVPWPLTTFEFAKMVKTHLKPNGAYLLNVIDNYDCGFMLGASYVTLKKAFKYVYVFCTLPLRIQNRRDTFVLVASDRPIDLDDWTEDSQYALDGMLLTTKNLAYLTKRCGGLILTDDFAPVENLLAPVVQRRKL